MDLFLSKMNDQGNPNDGLYYIENGLIVFTEAYHLKRGYCCKSGCRHCPFDKSRRARSTGPDREDIECPDKSNE